MPIYEECQVCGEVVKFDNMLDYQKTLKECGPEFECVSCREGPEDD